MAAPLLPWLLPLALTAQAPASPPAGANGTTSTTMSAMSKSSLSLSLTLRASSTLPMKSASAVAPLKDGSFLVVDDDAGVLRIRRKTATPWAMAELHPALGDLEGLCVDEEGEVFVVAEGGGLLLSLGEASGERPRVKELGALPRPAGGDGDDDEDKRPKKKGKKGKKNKGYEGLAALPARHSPDGKAGLVAVHEDRPKHVVVLDVDPLAVRLDLPLPDEVNELVDDLSDVTVDPVTGNLLLLSDESRRVVEVKLERRGLQLIGSVDLPVEDGEKPEGIAFVSDDRLVIVTDATNRLLTFDVKR